MAEASALPDEASSASSHVPDDSTIRILLLGRSGSGKSSSGNTILGQKAFTSPKRYKGKVTRTSEEHTADVGGRKVCVIDTPDLLDPDLFEDELDGEKEKLLSLCQSGLHAVLLVLPVGKGLQNEEEMLEFTKDLLGPDLQRFTMVLFTRGDELEDGETIEQHIQEQGEELKQLVDGCQGRHVFTNTQTDQKQVLQLLDMIDALVKRNKGSVFRRRRSMDRIINDEASSASSHVPDDSTIRILLLGRSGSGKSSSGNTILGQKAFISPKRYKEKVTRTSEEHTSDVGGRKVCVIDTPDLLDLDLSEDELDGEKEKLLSLCQSGLHAVLLVLPVGKGLQNEEEMLEFTKDLLGPDLQKFTMVLFTRGDELEDEETIEQLIQEEGEELKQLVDGCQGRHVFTNTQTDQKQVLQLLDMIDALVKRNKGSVFRRRRSKDWIINVSAGPEQRRLILLGKTGVGKSATGNTILGKNLFESKAGFSSQTRECTSKKIVRAGKEITVIDTPELFDQKETMREIINCLTYSSPGPHAFLIVIRIGRFTEEERETVTQLERVFGANAKKYTMILFTGMDDLERKQQKIEQYLEEQDPELKALVESCGNRFCCFNNHHFSFQQFKGLMDKIDSMVAANEETYYTDEVFQSLEQNIVVLQKEKLEEKLKASTEEEKLQSKWQKIYRRLLKESRNEAESTVIHKMTADADAIILAKCSGTITLTPAEVCSAILEAARQGVVITATTGNLERKNVCVIH